MGLGFTDVETLNELQHVSIEPSGDAFNSIELQDGTNRPHVFDCLNIGSGFLDTIL